MFVNPCGLVQFGSSGVAVCGSSGSVGTVGQCWR